jgi:hypothetical protein
MILQKVKIKNKDKDKCVVRKRNTIKIRL